MLGRGTFGRVDLIRDRKDGSQRVCKEVHTANMPARVRDVTRQEIEVLADLDHPNIIKLYEFSEDLEGDRFTLILEYIGGGDCHHLLTKSPTGKPFVFLKKVTCVTLPTPFPPSLLHIVILNRSPREDCTSTTRLG